MATERLPGIQVHHRGVSQTQEPNSFEAIASQYGSRVECDVFTLADGSLAVVHNADVGVKEQSEIEGMTLAEVNTQRRQHLNGEGGPKSVALLGEYLWLARDRGVGLDIEVKAGDKDAAIKTAESVVAEVLSIDCADFPDVARPAIHSFSVEALIGAVKACGVSREQISIGLLWPSGPNRSDEMKITKTIYQYLEENRIKTDNWAVAGVELAVRLGFDSIDLHDSIIDEEVIEMANKLGLRVIAWVVKDPERLKELESMGVWRVVTEGFLT